MPKVSRHRPGFLQAAAVCTAIVMSVNNAGADSSVWKISNGESHIYLGGTCVERGGLSTAS